MNDEHEAEARALGVHDYLFKPIDDAIVLASLRAALDQRSQEPYAGERDAQTVAERTARSAVSYLAGTTAGEDVSREAEAGENAFIASRLAPLVRDIQYSFPRVWRDVIIEKVEDALLEFLAKAKQGIWPVRGSLFGHLRQAAWRNVRDHVQSAARRTANEARYARERSPAVISSNTVLSADLDAALALGHKEAEMEAIRLWLEGESSPRIAEALGISELPSDEQLREVKRFKDRIKKRARRGI